MIRNKSRPQSHQFKRPKQQKVVDLSKQDNFLFNKTPILASALQKLKAHDSNDKKKKASTSVQGPSFEKHKEDIQALSKPLKKIKKDKDQQSLPSFAFTPLQKDLYNFYTLNKISLKTIESVPEPKFQVGSVILTAICDRGIGGKYLVTNLFRNKKGYIDYKDLSQVSSNKDDFSAIQSYQEPGDFVICSVIKSINPHHLQLSLSKFIDMDFKTIKLGQVLPAEIKSKQQLGCHLIVYKCKEYKIFLPKADLQEEIFEDLRQKTQIIVTIHQIDQTKKLIKVKLASEDSLALNLRGVEQQQMSKLQLQQYVSPGTLLNTKIVKVLKNGVMVKFLKIFHGFIHVDHLSNNLQYYAVESKIEARIIYSCLNPPLIYLSQRHVNINKYEPKRALYSPLSKPENLLLVQGSYFNKEQEFFVHPTQLHSEIDNITKFWVKENNYFQRYQIMTSRKLGLRVGEVAKQIPFSNFKIYGEGEGGRFKVICLDVWNKVVKVSYDEKFIKSTNILQDLEDFDSQKQYCGIIRSLNENGLNIQFCNNIRGILPKNQIKQQQIDIKQSSFGKAIEVYINHVKPRKNFATLSLVPPIMRKQGQSQKAKDKEGLIEGNEKGQSTYFGSIVSINKTSIHPIYIKLKTKLVKVSIFNGVRPPSLQNLTIIQELDKHYQIGQQVRVFRKQKEYFLYPPEQLSDKGLKICKVVGHKGSILRLQIGKSEFKNCHICDITDLITPFPFAEVNLGQYRIGRVLNNGMICLRDSIVRNGIPKSMIQCKQKYQSDQLRGDFRNRILTVGSSGLKQDMLLFGYIKSFSEKGCFVSVSNDFQVRVQMCQLTDQHITDKAKYYPTNKLMLLRLISEKVKPNDPTKHMFDASSRESVIKLGYPINEQALMVGLTVSGKVVGYTKGKALVRLDGSKFTGIMNPNEVQGLNKDLPIEKSMKLGTHYTMKIIQLNNDGKRLIRLSCLGKFFTKYKGVELGLEKDQRAENLWQNYQLLLAEQPPKKIIEAQLQQQEENSEEEYNRLKNMLENQINEESEEKQSEQKILNLQEALDLEQQEQQQIQEEALNNQGQNSQMVDENQQQTNKPKKLLENSLSKQQINRRLSQFRQMNNSSQTYQSILLANDSSESHLQYISSLISNPNIGPDQIRQQFSKSIEMLQTIKEKQNMWIAWLNMELILGDFMGLVKKAISQDAGLNVYNRIVQVLKQQENWDVALQMGKKMLKKFNNDPKAYTFMLKFMVSEQIHRKKQSITLKELLRRAEQCLKQRDIITIQSHYGKILYEEKLAEEARTTFTNILSKNPKRTDLWSMYIDLQTKHGSAEKAREIFERCLTIKLKRKKMISILKKYHQFQTSHGTPQSAAQILERAKEIAEQYENEKDQQSDDQD